MPIHDEVYISVDIETSGPIPGEFSLLTIGACLAFQPDIALELALQPISDNADPEAMAVTGLSLNELAKIGLRPVDAMGALASWVNENSKDGLPVFVGFNAAFDWSFINYYFHKYYGQNPFGFAALDIKSLYMGRKNCEWINTKSSRIASELKPTSSGSHNALQDARYQAELFRLIKAS